MYIYEKVKMHRLDLMISMAIASSAAVALAGGVFIAVRYHRAKSPSAATVKSFTELHDKSDSVVHLYTFPANPLAPSLTPFGVRVETFLRIANIPYKKHYTTNISASPTRSLPLVVYKGEAIVDSHQIIEVLSEKFNVNLDEGLTDSELAIGKAIRAMVDYNILFALGRSLYIDDKHSIVMPYVAAGLGISPRLVFFLTQMLRRNYSKKLKDIGILSIPKEQYEQALLNNIKALEELLGDKLFFGGEKPTITDCAVFSCLQSPSRLYFISQNRPHRQVEPMYSKDRKHIDQKSSMSSNSASTKDHTMSAGANNDPSFPITHPDYYVNEGLTYLVNSLTLMAYVQRMSDLAFPDLDDMLALTSPTRVQKDVAVLAAQVEHMKTRIERSSESSRS